MKLLLSLAAVVLFPSVQEGKTDPKARDRHPWLRWKEGSFVRFKLVSQSGAMKNEGTMTHTLVKIEEEGYTIRNATKMMGQEESKEQEMESGAGCALCDPEAEKLGEETLKIDGREYKCTILKSVTEQGGGLVENRVWYAEGVDLPLKQIARTTESSSIDTEVTAVKLEEEVLAIGKKFRCVRFEGRIKMAGREGSLTTWMNLEVPGGTLKTEVNFKEIGARTTMEVEEYEGNQ